MLFHLSSSESRRRPLRNLYLILVVLLIVCPSALSQSGGGIDMTGTDGKDIIQGRILFPSGQRVDVRLKVKLETVNAGELSVLADANGTFSFRSLGPGSYDVVVEGDKNYETARENVYIPDERRGALRSVASDTPRTYNVVIYLQPKETTDNGAKAAVVDASLANIPKPALDHYNKALEANRAGDARTAVLELQSAISLYPEFTLALNELGVQYLKAGEVDKALQVLRSALKISPDNTSVLLNYGIALLEKKNFAEAETELRKVVKKSDSLATAHYYLGLDLISQQRLDEAATELLSAIKVGGDQMAAAHYFLGGIYWRQKEYKRAAAELEIYLRLAPNAANAEKIRGTIKELRSKK
jgi:tetratricopeptide (TPR) repeat protein